MTDSRETGFPGPKAMQDRFSRGTSHEFDSAAIASEMEHRLQKLADPTTASLRAVRREFSRRLKAAAASEIVRLAFRLLNRYRFVAYELILHHPAALASLRRRSLEQLAGNLDSWGAVDCFACFIAGPAWRQRQVPDALLARWARSKDRWWRRAAVVSTVPLNNRARGGQGDSARTLALCELVVGDSDDMVEKALSWALRELSKRDPAAVRKFVEKHRTFLAARVLREVTAKLTTGRKNPGEARFRPPTSD